MRISFAHTLVTGVTRQLTNDEHWTLYYFEDHASKCPACYNPAAVHKSRRQLCDDGRELACNVAALLFRLREDGQVYAEEDEQFVRVEMPAKYEHVAGLFKAVQASRSGILVRPRSMDAHYDVRPRIPAYGLPVGGHVAAQAADDFEFDYSPRAAQYSLATSGGQVLRAGRARARPRRTRSAGPENPVVAGLAEVGVVGPPQPRLAVR